MSTLLASVAAYTVLTTLLIATAAHLRGPGSLRRAVAAHGLLRAPTLVAAAVITAEGVLGGSGGVAVALDARGVLAAALAGSALLFALFGGYGWYVTSTGRTGPCGCSRGELPMSGWVVARAVALAGLAVVGLVGSDSVLPLSEPGTELTTVLLAAAAFGCLLWQLPAAMYDPAPVGVTAHLPVPGPDGVPAGRVAAGRIPGVRIEGGAVRR